MRKVLLSWERDIKHYKNSVKIRMSLVLKFQIKTFFSSQNLNTLWALMISYWNWECVLCYYGTVAILWRECRGRRWVCAWGQSLYNTDTHRSSSWRDAWGGGKERGGDKTEKKTQKKRRFWGVPLSSVVWLLVSNPPKLRVRRTRTLMGPHPESDDKQWAPNIFTHHHQIIQMNINKFFPLYVINVLTWFEKFNIQVTRTYP